MYLLDTNVVSLLDPRRQSSAKPLVDWMQRNGDGLFLSAMTLAEMQAGVLKLRRQDKYKRAEEIANLVDGIEATFGERMLPMGGRVARAVARLEDHIRPRTIELADLIIAATADAHSLVMLTRNVRHFGPTGVPVIDPFVELPPDIS